MSRMDTFNGVEGEWRNVTRKNKLKPWQDVKYKMYPNDIWGYSTFKEKPDVFQWRIVKAFYPDKPKVAKVTIEDKGNQLIWWFCMIGKVRCSMRGFARSRKDAIQRAEKFCQTIGFEMEVVKVEE